MSKQNNNDFEPMYDAYEYLIKLNKCNKYNIPKINAINDQRLQNKAVDATHVLI